MKKITFLFILNMFTLLGQTPSSITIGGVSRSYIYYTPSSWNPSQNVPLLIVLHGLTQTGAGLMDITQFNQIAEQNGFYFLCGREAIVEIRQKRYNYSCAKLKIAKQFSRLFSYLPYVKVVAVANLLGDHNLKIEIDSVGTSTFI